MNQDGSIRGVLNAGLRHSLRLHLWLPLYLLSTLPGLVQAIPAIAVVSLRNPYLGDLAVGGADAWLDALLSEPEGVPQMAVLAFGLALFYAAGYNFVSGALLCKWSGKRGYLSGGTIYFLTFATIGTGLAIFLFVAAGVAGAIGGVAGPLALAVLALAAQALNLIGEVARALAVQSERRNPFVLLVRATVFVARRPGRATAVAGIGAGLHGLVLIGIAVTAGWTPHPLVLIAIQQALVLAWLWVKVLRLAWALQLVSTAEEFGAVALPTVASAPRARRAPRAAP